MSCVEVTEPTRKTCPLPTLGKLTRVKLHRAIVLVVMMLIAVGAFVLLTAAGIANFDSHSLIALVVVVVAAALGGGPLRWERHRPPSCKPRYPPGSKRRPDRFVPARPP